MKKILFILLLNLVSVGLMKAEKVYIPVSLYSNSSDSDKGHIRHTPPARLKLPFVECDEHFIYISSLDPDADLHLILYDNFGNSLYSCSSIMLSSVSFLIPQDVMRDASTLVLKVDGVTYTGEF